MDGLSIATSKDQPLMTECHIAQTLPTVTVAAMTTKCPPCNIGHRLGMKAPFYVYTGIAVRQA